MDANYAYLIRVNTGVVNLNWNITGKPVAPSYKWNDDGINLVGFPLQTPADLNDRNLDTFYSFDKELSSASTLATWTYVGGELSAVNPKNPRAVDHASTPGIRHRAYWVDADGFTEYYGPVRVSLSTPTGLHFGTDGENIALRLKNVTNGSTAAAPVTVTVNNVLSEASPLGPAGIPAAVPLRVRGELNLTNGLYAYTNLNAVATNSLVVSLQPGEEREFIVTVDRSQMAGVPGVRYQSLLRVTDSLNQTRIMLPVAAETPSRAGLWAGAAVLNQVNQIIGNSSTNQGARASFPLRLILHSDASGTVRLLQQAYVSTNLTTVVSNHEDGFVAPAKATSRMASASFPVGYVAVAAGQIGLTGTVTLTVPLGFNSPSNPFVHNYHPDHNNLDERDQPLSAGRESNDITRSITLTFQAQNPAGFDPAWGASSLGGAYTETVTGLRSTPIVTSGAFVLHRQSAAATFVAAP